MKIFSSQLFHPYNGEKKFLKKKQKFLFGFLLVLE